MEGTTMECKEYNGWYNYETWVVNLWMDNEEGTYNYWRERTEERLQNIADYEDMGADMDSAKYDLSQEIKEYHEEIIEEVKIENGFISDLLNGAMSEVNWYEIAEHLIDAFVQDAKAEKTK
jgi:hypothetical protein